MNRWWAWYLTATPEQRERHHHGWREPSRDQLHWRLSCRWARLAVEQRRGRVYPVDAWWRLGSSENRARYLQPEGDMVPSIDQQLDDLARNIFVAGANKGGGNA